MTKKHEELVEEIAEYLTKSYRKGFQACVNHHKPEEGIVPERDAKRIITLILSAVRDGLEIPGEIGRGYFDDLGPADPVWDCYYIALRPPTIELDEPSFIAEIH